MAIASGSAVASLLAGGSAATRSTLRQYLLWSTGAVAVMLVAILGTTHHGGSAQELTYLIGTFPYLPPVDVSLMLADDALLEKLESFHHDHGHMLVAPRNWLLAALLSTGALAAVIMWLAAGA